MSSYFGLIERTLEAPYQPLRLAGPTSPQGSRSASEHTLPDLSRGKTSGGSQAGFLSGHFS